MPTCLSLNEHQGVFSGCALQKLLRQTTPTGLQEPGSRCENTSVTRPRPRQSMQQCILSPAEGGVQAGPQVGMLGERRERSGRVAAPLVGEHGWGEDTVHPDGPLGADTLFAVKHLGVGAFFFTVLPVCVFKCSPWGLEIDLSNKSATGRNVFISDLP